MGNRKGDQQKEPMLDDATARLFARPRHRVELASLHRIPVNQALDPAKNLLQEYRLRTGPAAPDAAEQRGDIVETETQARDQEEQQPKVLRRQGRAKKMEAPICDVQEYRRVSVDRYPRETYIDEDQHERRNPAGDVEPSFDVSGMQELPRSILSDRRD